MLVSVLKEKQEEMISSVTEEQNQTKIQVSFSLLSNEVFVENIQTNTDAKVCDDQLNTESCAVKEIISNAVDSGDQSNSSSAENLLSLNSKRYVD